MTRSAWGTMPRHLDGRNDVGLHTLSNQQEQVELQEINRKGDRAA